ncbi:alpha/beta hydrolase [Amylibacter sp. SFDW26]|uniref:alpha/beta fold hydrolase n=1 Tax=Amylibacter sp. SFDW26 TaxID=2652722 RepID=UPI0012616E23|nr:alpha/beta hydrolase [Amylibacter sp. SFDW26]KAB7613647.1 alpha/beta hydrolase [Amylibacter sp. SFDW26]
MTEPQFFDTSLGRKIAYHKTDGEGVGVVFLGGFKSDMEGTKAVFLEDWAKSNGRPFLRFDYSGHGLSSGKFEDGCIGDWADDALEIISELTDGKQILVGSSMGGWIALLMAKRIPEWISGLVGIAAAPDFTEDSMWANFTDAQQKKIMVDGQLALDNDYSDEPYIITKKLIEDGRDQLILREPLDLPFPVRLLHGTADADVDMSVPLRILDHVTGDDVRLSLIKGADHRFSEPENLAMIRRAVHSVTMKAGT